jgi:hypothetical protein
MLVVVGCSGRGCVAAHASVCVPSRRHHTHHASGPHHLPHCAADDVRGWRRATRRVHAAARRGAASDGQSPYELLGVQPGCSVQDVRPSAETPSRAVAVPRLTLGKGASRLRRRVTVCLASQAKAAFKAKVKVRFLDPQAHPQVQRRASWQESTAPVPLGGQRRLDMHICRPR